MRSGPGADVLRSDLAALVTSVSVKGRSRVGEGVR